MSRSSLYCAVKYVAFADCEKRPLCPQCRKTIQNKWQINKTDSSDRIRFSTGWVRISEKPVRRRHVGGEHVRSRRPSELRAHALESHFRPNKSVDEKRDNASRRLVVKRRQTVVVYTAFFYSHTSLGRVRKQCTVVNLRGITFHRRCRCARSWVPYVIIVVDVTSGVVSACPVKTLYQIVCIKLNVK